MAEVDKTRLPTRAESDAQAEELGARHSAFSDATPMPGGGFYLPLAARRREKVWGRAVRLSFDDMSSADRRFIGQKQQEGTTQEGSDISHLAAGAYEFRNLYDRPLGKLIVRGDAGGENRSYKFVPGEHLEGDTLGDAKDMALSGAARLGSWVTGLTELLGVGGEDAGSVRREFDDISAEARAGLSLQARSEDVPFLSRGHDGNLRLVISPSVVGRLAVEQAPNFAVFAGAGALLGKGGAAIVNAGLIGGSTGAEILSDAENRAGRELTEEEKERILGRARVAAVGPSLLGGALGYGISGRGRFPGPAGEAIEESGTEVAQELAARLALEDPIDGVALGNAALTGAILGTGTSILLGGGVGLSGGERSAVEVAKAQKETKGKAEKEGLGEAEAQAAATARTKIEKSLFALAERGDEGLKWIDGATHKELSKIFPGIGDLDPVDAKEAVRAAVLERKAKLLEGQNRASWQNAAPPLRKFTAQGLAEDVPDGEWLDIPREAAARGMDLGEILKAGASEMGRRAQAEAQDIGRQFDEIFAADANYQEARRGGATPFEAAAAADQGTIGWDDGRLKAIPGVAAAQAAGDAEGVAAAIGAAVGKEADEAASGQAEARTREKDYAGALALGGHLTNSQLFLIGDEAAAAKDWESAEGAADLLAKRESSYAKERGEHLRRTIERATGNAKAKEKIQAQEAPREKGEGEQEASAQSEGKPPPPPESKKEAADDVLQGTVEEKTAKESTPTLVLYHGTGADFEGLPNKPIDGGAGVFYTTAEESARRHAKGEGLFGDKNLPKGTERKARVIKVDASAAQFAGSAKEMKEGDAGYIDGDAYIVVNPASLKIIDEGRKAAAKGEGLPESEAVERRAVKRTEKAAVAVQAEETADDEIDEDDAVAEAMGKDDIGSLTRALSQISRTNEPADGAALGAAVRLFIGAGDKGFTERMKFKRQLPTAKVQFDAATFQHRARSSATGKTDRMLGARKYEDDTIVHVWERKDGALFVANGHQRVNLAKEKGAPEISAVVMSETDGWTAEMARAQGLRDNIKDTPSHHLQTALEIAREIQASAADAKVRLLLLANYPPTEKKLWDDGIALSRLSESELNRIDDAIPTIGTRDQKKTVDRLAKAAKQVGYPPVRAVFIGEILEKPNVSDDIFDLQVRNALFSEVESRQGALAEAAPSTEIKLLFKTRGEILIKFHRRVNDRVRELSQLLSVAKGGLSGRVTDAERGEFEDALGGARDAQIKIFGNLKADSAVSYKGDLADEITRLAKATAEGKRKGGDLSEGDFLSLLLAAEKNYGVDISAFFAEAKVSPKLPSELAAATALESESAPATFSADAAGGRSRDAVYSEFAARLGDYFEGRASAEEAQGGGIFGDEQVGMTAAEWREMGAELASRSSHYAGLPNDFAAALDEAAEKGMDDAAFERLRGLAERIAHGKLTSGEEGALRFAALKPPKPAKAKEVKEGEALDAVFGSATAFDADSRQTSVFDESGDGGIFSGPRVTAVRTTGNALEVEVQVNGSRFVYTAADAAAALNTDGWTDPQNEDYAESQSLALMAARDHFRKINAVYEQGDLSGGTSWGVNARPRKVGRGTAIYLAKGTQSGDKDGSMELFSGWRRDSAIEDDRPYFVVTDEGERILEEIERGVLPAAKELGEARTWIGVTARLLTNHVDSALYLEEESSVEYNAPLLEKHVQKISARLREEIDYVIGGLEEYIAERKYMLKTRTDEDGEKFSRFSDIPYWIRDEIGTARLLIKQVKAERAKVRYANRWFRKQNPYTRGRDEIELFSGWRQVGLDDLEWTKDDRDQRRLSYWSRRLADDGGKDRIGALIAQLTEKEQKLWDELHSLVGNRRDAAADGIERDWGNVRQDIMALEELQKRAASGGEFYSGGDGGTVGLPAGFIRAMRDLMSRDKEFKAYLVRRGESAVRAGRGLDASDYALIGEEMARRGVALGGSDAAATAAALRPGMTNLDSGLLPVPPSIVGDYNGTLAEEQRLGVDMILSAHRRGLPGFFLMDAQGVGKTRQMLAAAHEMAKEGKRVLLIAPSRQVVEVYYREAESLGLSQMRGIHFATYADVRRRKIKNAGDYAGVFFDEAQEIRNPQTGKSKEARELADGAEFVLWATGTPFDKPTGVAYFASRLLGEAEGEIISRLGLVEKQVVVDGEPQYFEDGSPRMRFEVKRGLSWGEDVRSAIVELREDMVARGLAVRRELPFWGDIKFERAEHSAEWRAGYDAVSLHFAGLIGAAYSPRAAFSLAGQRIQTLSRLTESEKASAIIRTIKRERAAGRSVAVFLEGVDEGRRGHRIRGLPPGTKAGWETSAEEDVGLIPTATEQVEAALEAEGIEFARVYGGKQDKSSEIRRFQTNQVDVVIATPQSGGVGISLDDQSGGAPRTAIIGTLNFSAAQVDQILFRISRRQTRSRSRAVFLINEASESDTRRREIFQMKASALTAIQQGRDPTSLLLEIGQMEADLRAEEGAAEADDVANARRADGVIVEKGGEFYSGGAAASPGGKVIVEITTADGNRFFLGRKRGRLGDEFGWVKSRRLAIEYSADVAELAIRNQERSWKGLRARAIAANPTAKPKVQEGVGLFSLGTTDPRLISRTAQGLRGIFLPPAGSKRAAERNRKRLEKRLKKTLARTIVGRDFSIEVGDDDAMHADGVINFGAGRIRVARAAAENDMGVDSHEISHAVFGLLDEESRATIRRMAERKWFAEYKGQIKASINGAAAHLGRPPTRSEIAVFGEMEALAYAIQAHREGARSIPLAARILNMLAEIWRTLTFQRTEADAEQAFFRLILSRKIPTAVRAAEQFGRMEKTRKIFTGEIVPPMLTPRYSAHNRRQVGNGIRIAQAQKLSRTTALNNLRIELGNAYRDLNAEVLEIKEGESYGGHSAAALLEELIGENGDLVNSHGTIVRQVNLAKWRGILGAHSQRTTAESQAPRRPSLSAAGESLFSGLKKRNEARSAASSAVAEMARRQRNISPAEFINEANRLINAGKARPVEAEMAREFFGDDTVEPMRAAAAKRDAALQKNNKEKETGNISEAAAKAKAKEINAEFRKENTPLEARSQAFLEAKKAVNGAEVAAAIDARTKPLIYEIADVSDTQQARDVEDIAPSRDERFNAVTTVVAYRFEGEEYTDEHYEEANRNPVGVASPPKEERVSQRVQIYEQIGRAIGINSEHFGRGTAFWVRYEDGRNAAREPIRRIVEIQSDIWSEQIPKVKNLPPHLKSAAKQYFRRMVDEEIARAQRDGIAELHFPSWQTAALTQRYHEGDGEFDTTNDNSAEDILSAKIGELVVWHGQRGVVAHKRENGSVEFIPLVRLGQVPPIGAFVRQSDTTESNDDAFRDAAIELNRYWTRHPNAVRHYVDLKTYRKNLPHLDGEQWEKYKDMPALPVGRSSASFANADFFSKIYEARIQGFIMGLKNKAATSSPYQVLLPLYKMLGENADFVAPREFILEKGERAFAVSTQGHEIISSVSDASDINAYAENTTILKLYRDEGKRLERLYPQAASEEIHQGGEGHLRLDLSKMEARTPQFFSFAKGADGQIAKAEEMKTAGESPDTIWRATRLVHEPNENEWLREISPGRLRKKAVEDFYNRRRKSFKASTRLGDIYDAPALYRRFPELRNVEVREPMFMMGGGGFGFRDGKPIIILGYLTLSYGNTQKQRERYQRWIDDEKAKLRDWSLPFPAFASPKRLRLWRELLKEAGNRKTKEMDKATLLDALEHEIQHYLDWREGRSAGASANAAAVGRIELDAAQARKMWTNSAEMAGLEGTEKREFRKALDKHLSGSVATLENMEALLSEIPLDKQGRVARTMEIQAYLSHFGEVRASESGKRSLMKYRQRKGLAPTFESQTGFLVKAEQKEDETQFSIPPPAAAVRGGKYDSTKDPALANIADELKDENGKPRVFYHGTDRDLTDFSPVHYEEGMYVRRTQNGEEILAYNDRMIFFTDDEYDALDYRNRWLEPDEIDAGKGMLKTVHLAIPQSRIFDFRDEAATRRARAEFIKDEGANALREGYMGGGWVMWNDSVTDWLLDKKGIWMFRSVNTDPRGRGRVQEFAISIAHADKIIDAQDGSRLTDEKKPTAAQKQITEKYRAQRRQDDQQHGERYKTDVKALNEAIPRFRKSPTAENARLMGRAVSALGEIAKYYQEHKKMGPMETEYGIYIVREAKDDADAIRVGNLLLAERDKANAAAVAEKAVDDGKIEVSISGSAYQLVEPRDLSPELSDALETAQTIKRGRGTQLRARMTADEAIELAEALDSEADYMSESDIPTLEGSALDKLKAKGFRKEVARLRAIAQSSGKSLKPKIDKEMRARIKEHAWWMAHRLSYEIPKEKGLKGDAEWEERKRIVHAFGIIGAVGMWSMLTDDEKTGKAFDWKDDSSFTNLARRMIAAGEKKMAAAATAEGGE